ncbi:MAG TPA: Rieske (2Fe-2S) protein [Patescibacteria group bacterium]|nr:Rieske (2Fe-2S) protein [Patescibacteria group bacterium]
MPIKARCGRADEIPPGGSKVVQVRERAVAIFNLAGTLYAIENTCPHQGGPLGEGYLEENGVISCPWHGWTFDLKTGVSPLDRDVRVGCYPVRVEEGLIVVELPG